ncbi:hypothetical protein Q2K19_08330 [Micromonospora soli]|uniref:hypothetical protein n=1 Tax=Micromonospora sp. NBRC 110009 TaxID=3061627 RepID=UPI002672F305|nr:hypothetical protein [Micromonospora sp. NBRC 110009]WKU00473.1 hypothetical protein Q2K19_08330 [Micromonospora sp. NBRC 110009]
MAGRSRLSRHPGRPVHPAGSADPGAIFAYVFDLGADWTHLCTVRRDEGAAVAHPPPLPLVRHGWGTLPDQYGRDRVEDRPTAPARRRSAGALTDLPPLLSSWGHRS